MALLRIIVQAYSDGAGEPQLSPADLHRRAADLFGIYVHLVQQNQLQLTPTAQAVPPPPQVRAALLSKARDEGRLVAVVAWNSSLVLHEQRAMMLFGPQSSDSNMCCQ
jgi:hypothetical protein